MPNPQDLLATSELDEWATDFFSENAITIVLTIAVAILVFMVGRWLARYLARQSVKWLAYRNFDAASAGFLSKVIYVILLAITTIVALSLLGIPMSSFLVILGAGVLAIGLALQDLMSNLASGFLLIILRPYAVNDRVETGEDHVIGNVESINFYHTALRTPDNSLLLVPNSKVMENPILNFSEMQWRRVDLEFGISYDDDLKVAKMLLLEIAQADPRVLAEPPIRVAVKELGDNSVNLVLQPYVHPEDYVSTRYDLIEQVKLRFDEAGLSFPFPQRTLHVASAS